MEQKHCVFTAKNDTPLGGRGGGARAPRPLYTVRTPTANAVWGTSVRTPTAKRCLGNVNSHWVFTMICCFRLFPRRARRSTQIALNWEPFWAVNPCQNLFKIHSERLPIFFNFHCLFFTIFNRFWPHLAPLGLRNRPVFWVSGGCWRPT